MFRLREEEQQYLLQLARRAVEEWVLHGREPAVEVPPGVMAEKHGAFVSLHKQQRLRGCVGYPQPLKPLYRTIVECAIAAAAHDPRFFPVTPREVAEVSLEITVLSPLFEIQPEQIEVGKHGLMISRGRERGLLLPQVAARLKWDRKRFLEETCSKAGLETDAWEHGAKLEAFTALVFAESEPPGLTNRQAV